MFYDRARSQTLELRVGMCSSLGALVDIFVESTCHTRLKGRYVTSRCHRPLVGPNAEPQARRRLTTPAGPAQRD